MTNNIDVLSFLREVRPKAIIYLQRQFRMSDFEAEDCFQEGSIAMWRNIHDGKLQPGNMASSLSTYLISCCRNHALHALRDNRYSSQFETHEYNLTEDGEIKGTEPADAGEADEEKEEMLRVLEDVVKGMTSPCKEILWHTYYNPEKLSQDDIARLTGVKNSQTVKAQKTRCMRNLKERMKQIFNI